MNRTYYLLFGIIFVFAGCSKSSSHRKDDEKNDFKIAVSQLKQGKYGLALDKFKKIQKKYRKEKKYWNAYGMALRYNAYLDLDSTLRIQEEKAFRQALKLDDNWVPPRLNLANTLWEKKKFKEAVEHYQKVLQLSPRHQDKKIIKLRIDRVLKSGKKDKTGKKPDKNRRK